MAPRGGWLSIPARERKNALWGRRLAAYRTERRGFAQSEPASVRARELGLSRLLDVALGSNPTGAAPGHEHEPLELRDEHTVLVVDARVHLHGAAVGL
jgi:hypothetical protein